MRVEMKVSTPRIRELRDLKGWSQEHLAAVAGVSLRTVQRLESEGSASRETVAGIAAAFETDIPSLADKLMVAREPDAGIALIDSPTVLKYALISFFLGLFATLMAIYIVKSG